MKPIYYKSPCSIFKGLMEGSNIFDEPGYIGIELGLDDEVICLRAFRSKTDLEEY